MKKIIILLIFANNSFCQNLDSILKSKDIYILFESKNHIQKKYEKIINDTLTLTRFELDFRDKMKVGRISLFYRKMKSTKENLFADKIFLKKYKKIIIDEIFLLKNNNLEKIKFLFKHNSKVNFYVIDNTKKINDNYIIYPVQSTLHEVEKTIE